MIGLPQTQQVSGTPAQLPHGLPGAAAATASETALRVLVVEDDPPVREACLEIAKSMGFVTAFAESVPAAREALGSVVDIVLLDMKLPGGNGLALLSEIRQRHPSAVVVLMTAFASVHSAVEALRVGAADYLAKPFTLEELGETLQRASLRRSFDMEPRGLRERLRTGRGEGALVGHSEGMEKLYRILSKVAATAHPVLILGECGTGKGTVARAIHMNGPRANEPFAIADCPGPAAVVERELFGSADGPGLLAGAGGGTVFLDEIAELPAELQTKLLRALEERAVWTAGATEPAPITARILAASSRDLRAMVDGGRFRRDLFFRLNVVNLRVPPLRERKPDIPLLAAQILERLREEKGQPYSFAEDTIEMMMSYEWPGNVRELEHAIERACALSSGPVLHLGDLPTQLQNARLQMRGPAEAEISVMAEAEAPVAAGSGAVVPIAEIERQVILRTLRQLNGDKLMAARLLGIGKTTLYRKLKEYDLGADEM